MSKIVFQSLNEAAEVATLHPLTREVLEVALAFWPTDKDMHINEIARSVYSRDWNPQSWHCQGKPPVRAVDISLKDITELEEARIVSAVEARFAYDPQRPAKPVALVHAPRHLHIQTHPRTMKKAR